jgi:prophage DNA circulation protein
MSASTREAVEAARLAALELAAFVQAGEVLPRPEAEQRIAEVRALALVAMEQALAEWDVEAEPLVRALQALAARQLDLLEALSDGRRVLRRTLTRERGLLDLALELYGDAGRAEDLLDLNPSLRRPHRIPAGTEVAHHAE